MIEFTQRHLLIGESGDRQQKFRFHISILFSFLEGLSFSLVLVLLFHLGIMHYVLLKYNIWLFMIIDDLSECQNAIRESVIKRYLVCIF